MSRWGAMWNLWLDGPRATRPWSSAREDEGGGSWPAAESGAWGLTWHRGEAWGWPWGCGGACLPLGPSTGGDKDHCVPGGGAGPVPGLRQDSGPSCLQCRLVKQSTRPPRSFLLADQLHPGALGTFHRDAAPESTSAQPHRDPHYNLGACLPAPPSVPRTRHPWPLGPTGLRPWSVPGAGLRPPAVSEVVSWVTTAQVTTARSRASAEVPLVKEALGGASLSWGLPGPCLPPFSCPPPMW